MTNGFFSPQTGRKIQQFGAALSGQLPQFQALQQRRQEAEQLQQERETERLRKLDSERTLALGIDNRAVNGLLKAGDTSGAIEFLDKRVSNILRLEGDPADTKGLLDQIKSGDIDGAIKESQLVDDAFVNRKLLPKQDKQVDSFTTRVVKNKLVTFKPDGTGVKVADIPGIAEKGDLEPEVQSAKVLDDGTIIAVMKNGTRRVRGPSGDVLTGEAAAGAIRTAQRFGAEVQGSRATERGRGAELGKSTIQQANKAFEKLPGIDKNIANIDSAIAAIDRGAKTGVVESLLPSVRSASIELENSMNLLGLDIISAVTFGALSEGELKLALDTAIPTKLAPPELRKWLENKKTVQVKLRGFLEETAKGLIGGKTISDIVDARIQSRFAGNGPAPTPGQPSTSGIKVLSIK